MEEADYEEDYEEDDQDTHYQPYYRQPQVTMQQQGCLATIRVVFLHIVVTHIALALCLGTLLLGGSLVVKGLTWFGWHGFSTILVGGLMIMVYVAVVVIVIASASHLGKRITKDDKF